MAITVNSARVMVRSGANFPPPTPSTMPREARVSTARAYQASGATSVKRAAADTSWSSRRL